MALVHSRCTSCAAPRCPPRITIVVIRSAVNAAMSQAGTSLYFITQPVWATAGVMSTPLKIFIGLRMRIG